MPSLAELPPHWWLAVPSGVALAVVAVRMRAATVPGALVGLGLVLAYASAPGPAPVLSFFLFVVLGSLSSRWPAAAYFSVMASLP